MSLSDNKTYLQCGEEDNCKNKDCLKCTRRKRMSLSLTHAEMICIEDFAVIDLQSMIDEKPEELDLMQKIMMKVMHKVFKEEKK